MADPRLAFRDAMSRWASGVTVVTAAHGGVRAGLVASSFTSVSADPPTILVCIDRRSRSLPTIEAAGTFAVNVLASAQDQAFRVFAGLAGDVPDKFAACDDEVRNGETGSPILGRSLAWFECRRVAAYPGGASHVIMVGEVVDCGVGDGPGGRPMVYFARGARELAPA